MADGCIINISCPVCHEIVWEDDWYPVDNVIIHEECLYKYIAKKKKISLEHYETMTKADEIKLQILGLKKEMEDDSKFYKHQISKLEGKLKNLRIFRRE